LTNVSMSLGTCAGRNYSETCEARLTAFTRLATPFYYDCKESKLDESQSDENRHAMVYYFHNDYECPDLVCEDVDGWNSACAHQCVRYNSDFSSVRDILSVSECASMCTGDCTAFEWRTGSRYSGCSFYTGTVLREYREPWVADSSRKVVHSGCFQRVPDLKGNCSWSSDTPDAGDGWIVECGNLCQVDGAYDLDRLPFQSGVTMKECGESCAAADCGGFHYSPQNGGSCQLLPGTVTGSQTESPRTFIGGACVHKEIQEDVDDDSGSSALRLPFFALTILLFFA